MIIKINFKVDNLIKCIRIKHCFQLHIVLTNFIHPSKRNVQWKLLLLSYPVTNCTCYFSRTWPFLWLQCAICQPFASPAGIRLSCPRDSADLYELWVRWPHADAAEWSHASVRSPWHTQPMRLVGQWCMNLTLHESPFQIIGTFVRSIPQTIAIIAQTTNNAKP